MKKKIKTITVFVLMLALVATATGCGGEKAVKVPDDSESSSSVETSSSNDKDTSAAKPKGKSDASISDYTLTTIFIYFGDVTWVKGYDEIWHLIDKKGDILLDLEAGNVVLSDVWDGVTVVENDSEYIGLTTENKIVSSLSKADYDTVESIDYTTVVLVSKETKTLEGNSTEYGLFDMGKDEWLAPLGELPIKGSGNCKYLGDSVYSFGDILFNTDTQNIKLPSGDWYYSHREPPEFFEGIGVEMAMNSDESLFIQAVNSKDFSTTKLLNLGYHSYTTCVVMSDSLIFVAPSGSYEDEDADIKTGLYDMSGNLVADLSEYNFQVAEAIDGNLLATLSNPNGTKFTTVFDKTGKMLFEPIEGEYSCNSDGLFLLNDRFYDLNGNLAFKTEDTASYSEYGFVDGVCWSWYTADSGMRQARAIDKKGETLFETGYVGQ